MTIEIEALQLKIGNQVGNAEEGFETIVARSHCLVDTIGELIIMRLRSRREEGTHVAAADFIWALEPDYLVSVKRDGAKAHIDPELEALMELDRPPLNFRSYEEV